MAVRQSQFAMHHLILSQILNISARQVTYALIYMLSACSQLPIQENINIIPMAQLESLQNWSIQGKLGIKSGNSGYNLLANWQQRKENFVLQLSGPLGLKPLILSNNRTGGISIQRSGALIHYNSVEALEAAVPELAGFGDYLVAMPNWLKGLPHNAYPVENISQGHVKPRFIKQKGWSIEYEDFIQAVSYTHLRAHET